MSVNCNTGISHVLISLSHFYQDSQSVTEKLSSQVGEGGEKGEGDRGILMTKNRKRMEKDNPQLI